MIPWVRCQAIRPVGFAGSPSVQILPSSRRLDNVELDLVGLEEACQSLTPRLPCGVVVDDCDDLQVVLIGVARDAGGEPDDAAEAEALNEFYDAIEFIADSAEWSRLTGGREYLTVTLAGRDRDELLAAAAALCHRADPDRWQVLATPTVNSAGAL